MKKKLFLFAAIHFTLSFFAQIIPDLIIKDVHVITMTNNTITKTKSIAITNGKITGIDDFSKLKKNASTKVIDAKGKYIMPGLTDMHLHLPSANQHDTFINTVIAAGVTHIRIMHSDEPMKQQRVLLSKIDITPKIYFPYVRPKSL